MDPEKAAIDVVNEIKESLGDAWTAMSEDEKESVARVARRYLKLKFDSHAGKDVSKQLAVVTSTIKDWKVVGSISFHDAFMKGVKKAGEILASFLVAGLVAL